MAKISLKALAAAICPNINGSSTIGVIKSTVNMTAISRLIRYTAASSLYSKLLNTFSSFM